MTSSSPAVSCVLATHNGAETLGGAVRSLLLQTLTGIEVVVVDDCSSDGTTELLAAIDDPRLVILRNEQQLGLAGSLNKGLAASRARYVARLDADDVAMPERLERQLEEIRRRDAAVLGTSALEIDARGRPGRLHHMPAEDLDVRWRMLFSSPFFHPSVLVDRTALDRDGLRYDVEFEESEDYDLWSRLLRNARGGNLREPLLLKRRHPGQATRRRRDIQRAFQRTVALREIGDVAPALSADGAELAWLVGSGEPVPDGRLVEAADAFTDLMDAFGRRHGAVPRSVRLRAAHDLARVGTRSSNGPAASEVIRHALRLDPALPVRLLAGRGRRRVETREATRAGERWLQTIAHEPGDPLRVVVVSPEPTPYRAPLLDRIAARADIDLTVVYASRSVGGRTWTVEPEHRSVYLDGITVPLASRLVHHDYPVTPGIWRALRHARPDVVVISGWSTFAAQAAVVWCRLQSVPYVLLVVSHDVGPRAGWRAAVKSAVVPRLVRGAANVLVVGTLARESVLARGAVAERVRVFANTIDVELLGKRVDALAPRRAELRSELGLADDDVVVLSVARLAPEKRHDILIRAVAETGDARLVLVLVGDGPERDALARLATTLAVRLVLAGDRPWEQVAEAYAASDIFALLSQRETWGVVVNEAAACGLPLVLSRQVGAAADLLQDGVNGSVVPAGSVDAAAVALTRLASDPGARAAAGAESRRMVAGWGYEPSVDAFVESVREAAAR